MAYCCVLGCTEKFVKGGNVTFHSFPRDEYRRQKWLQNVNQENLIVKSHTKVCSKHFRAECFEKLKFGGTWLKSDAIPTIFDSTAHLLTINKKRNKREDEMEITETSIEKLAYIGDFSIEDMDSPSKAQKLLELAKLNLLKHREEVASLQRRSMKFMKRILTMNRMIKDIKTKPLTSDNESNNLKILPDIPESSSIAGTSGQESSSRLTHLPYSESSCGVRIKQEPVEDSYPMNEHASPSLGQSVSLTTPFLVTPSPNLETSVTLLHESSFASSIHHSNTEPPSCKKIKRELDEDSSLPSENSLPTIEDSFSVTPTETAVCSTSRDEKSSFEIRIELLGKNWMEKMKTLRPDQRIYAEKLINDVFFEAELGLLKHGCHVENSS